MTPEAFDDFCRKKIEQLDQVPQLEWNEKRAWNKLNIKLRNNYRIFSFTVIAFLLAFLLLGLWKYGFRESLLLTDNIKPLKQSNLQAKLSLKTPVQTVDTLDKVKAYAKKGLQTAVDKPLKEEKQPSPLPHVTTIKTIPSTDSINNKISGPSHTLTDKINILQEDSLSYTPANISEKPYRNKSGMNETDTEISSSVGSTSYSAGISFVKPLSKRFSILYGFRPTKIYNPIFNPETYISSADAIGVQMPVQFRYYLLPAEKRFTVFLYAGFTGYLPISGLNTATYPALRLETGAEARYRLWENKDSRSKAYLFVRMPLYNRTIINYPYNKK